MMMMMLYSRLFVAIIWVLGIVSGQPILPAGEVESLRVIARILRKSDWDFNVDPCSGLSGWVSPVDPVDKNYANELTCDCNFQNNTACHVVSIILKAQNLSGSVPRDLIRLPFLREIDLTRNYLNGTIPPEWGSMNLVNISLLGNRVSGSIPTQLANISSLTKLNLEYNQLSGTIPPQFGSLTRIVRLTLNSNYLTGELPASLSRLSTLRDFRISDNNFQGIIPNFIQNWINIERLEIQSSGLSGPIPAGIASLTNLKYLRISDLSGNGSTFPPFSNMINLDTLILRSCNIVGELPVNIGEMFQRENLKILDLSFNNLSGPIPASFSRLSDTDYIYLTGNSLSGPLPAWMLTEGDKMDLSYNNLIPSSSTPNCQTRNLNLFASSKGNTLPTGTTTAFRLANKTQDLHWYSKRLDEENNTHISTRISGTFGYMAPEYAMRGYLTDKADVYSFGVVVFEVVSGSSNIGKYKGDTFNLLEWANTLKEEGKLMELVDPRLGSNFNEEEVMMVIHLGLLCTNTVAAERLNMLSVVSILEGKAGLEDFVSYSNVSMDKIEKATDDQSDVSMDVPWTASSTASRILKIGNRDTSDGGFFV